MWSYKQIVTCNPKPYTGRIERAKSLWPIDARNPHKISHMVWLVDCMMFLRFRIVLNKVVLQQSHPNKAPTSFSIAIEKRKKLKRTTSIEIVKFMYGGYLLVDIYF